MSTDAAGDVDVITARRLQTEGEARLLDVRDDEEWDAGHVEGAVHIALETLGGRFGELDKSGHWLVICRSGGRSSKAAEAMRSGGYDARSVAGGMRAWAEQSLPFTAVDGAAGMVI